MGNWKKVDLTTKNVGVAQRSYQINHHLLLQKVTDGEGKVHHHHHRYYHPRGTGEGAVQHQTILIIQSTKITVEVKTNHKRTRIIKHILQGVTAVVMATEDVVVEDSQYQEVQGDQRVQTYLINQSECKKIIMFLESPLHLQDLQQNHQYPHQRRRHPRRRHHHHPPQSQQKYQLQPKHQSRLFTKRKAYHQTAHL